MSRYFYKEGKKIYINEVWLRNKYIKDKRSIKWIADRVGCSEDTVKKYLKKYNIKTRTKSDDIIKRSKKVKIDKNFIDCVNGLLLGDGSLTKCNKSGASSLEISQREDRIDWILKLKNFFMNRNIDCKIYDIKNYNNSKRQKKLSTKTYIIFGELRKKWYDETRQKYKKILPKDIDLNRITIAYWYCGDGHLSYSEKQKCYSIKLGTYGFTKKEVEYLRDKLYELYGFEFKIYRHNKTKDKNRGFYLSLHKQKQVIKFCDLIKNFIPKPFKYKIRCLENHYNKNNEITVKNVEINYNKIRSKKYYI